MPERPGCIINGFNAFRERKEFCDVILAVANEQFFAHRAVLAAASPHFRAIFAQQDSVVLEPLMLNLVGIRHPEALRAFLDYIYMPSFRGSTYQPSNEEVNCDFLRLARQFEIPELLEIAARWLAQGLTTKNILQRLRACEEFELREVREKILEQLTANPEALYVVAQDPDFVKIPAVLQELMVRVLRLIDCDGSSQKGQDKHGKGPAPKNTRKAGA